MDIPTLKILSWKEYYNESKFNQLCTYRKYHGLYIILDTFENVNNMYNLLVHMWIQDCNQDGTHQNDTLEPVHSS